MTHLPSAGAPRASTRAVAVMGRNRYAVQAGGGYWLIGGQIGNIPLDPRSASAGRIAPRSQIRRRRPRPFQARACIPEAAGCGRGTRPTAPSPKSRPRPFPESRGGFPPGAAALTRTARRALLPSAILLILGAREVAYGRFFRSLTPGPSPFSSMKITPAASSAARIAARLSGNSVRLPSNR